MIPRIECEGAPRDLGLDQGRAQARLVRAGLSRGALTASRRGPRAWASDFGEWLARARRADPLDVLWRDLRRHFPHLAERSEGLAQGARVALRDLLPPLAELAGAPEAGAHAEGAAAAQAAAEPVAAAQAAAALPPLAGGAALALAAPAATGGGRAQAWLLRALALPRRSARGLVLRHARPESAFASAELALAALAPALAGVNQAGLAAVFAPPPPISYTEEWSSGSVPACAAPALLLLQQCLERFDGVAPAVEWCLRRPAGGCGALLFADAAGQLGGVELRGAARAPLVAREGVLPAAARPGAALELEKRARERGAADGLEALCAVLEEAAGADACGASLFLDPATRRLGVRRCSGSPADPPFEILVAAAHAP